MNDYHSTAKIFKAFCDENRLQIIKMLQDGEKCACVLLEQLNITQATLSHHMKILVESEVVAARKEGKWTYYSINSLGAYKVQTLLASLLKGSEHIEIGGETQCN